MQTLICGQNFKNPNGYTYSFCKVDQYVEMEKLFPVMKWYLT